ncbi:MAG: DUF4115 domain-containing protein [Thermostichales cyanobacterium BF3_bins_165]
MSPTSPTPGFSSLAAIGAFLREQRELRQLTLHTVAHDTHIRLCYLDALEQGQPQQLPELVYVRGFLTRYGDYLGLDGRALSQAWVELAEDKPGDPRRAKKGSREPIVALRPLHLWAVYVGVVIAAVSGLSYVVGGSASPLGRWWQAWRTPPSAEPEPERLFATPQDWTAIQGVFPVSEPTPPSAPPDGVLDGVLVEIRVLDRPSWIRVIADNRTVLEDTLPPGTEMRWTADESIVLRAGNAGSVAVTWNHQPQGILGNFGEVREKVYGRHTP